MPSRTREISALLAGEAVHGHVVVLSDTWDEGYDVLLPFIAEGFEQGDRALHIIDPAVRDSHLERLTELGIDVEATTVSGQLDVRTWNEGFLRGGSFDPAEQLVFLRNALTEARGMGYPRTRYIGSTEWAIGKPDVLRDLLTYEGDIDQVVHELPDVVVCSYDLSRHSARFVADVLGVHTAAVVGGIVRTSSPGVQASARDRLVTAASKLFQEQGIQATGIDAIIQAARVAKATFYRHFPSKDDLVVAWLRDPRTRWLDRVRADAERGGTAQPTVVILRFFDALAAWLEAEGYRGCPYLNTAVEITDPTHPALTVVTDYLREVEDYLASLAARAGFEEPHRLGSWLQALVAGSISLAVARRSGAHAQEARAAAQALLSEAGGAAGTNRD